MTHRKGQITLDISGPKIAQFLMDFLKNVQLANVAEFQQRIPTIDGKIDTLIGSSNVKNFVLAFESVEIKINQCKKYFPRIHVFSMHFQYFKVTNRLIGIKART